MGNSGELRDINDKLIDLELAKSDNKNSRVKKYLPAVVMATSLYYSLLLASGILLGYLGSKIFSKYLLESGKVDCIFIDCGKYKIHLHHWITGAFLLILAGVLDYFYLPRFFVGVLLGIIAHDIYDFNDWHKILVKKESH
jgi:hypothetical protein